MSSKSPDSPKTIEPQSLFRLEDPQPLARGFKAILSTSLVLILVGAILFGGWKALIAFAQFFSGLQKEVLAALVAAFATITVSVVTVVVGKYYERKRGIEQEIRNKKIPIYEEFIQFMFKFIYAVKDGKSLPDEEVQAFFNGFSQKMIIWGSDEVIRAWVRFRRGAANGDRAAAAANIEHVLLAIRKDTGHPNRGFMKGELLGFFVNDAESTEKQD